MTAIEAESVSCDRGSAGERSGRGFVRLADRSAHWLILSVYCAYALIAFVRLSDHQGPVGGYDDWGYFLKARLVRRWLFADSDERMPFLEMAARAGIHSPLHVSFYALLLRSDKQDTSPLQRTSQRAIQLLQLALSAIALWMVYRISLRLYSRRTALVALLLGAVSFPVIAQSLMLLEHALSAVLLLVILWLLITAKRFPELSVTVVTLGALALAGFRYGYIYLSPVLLGFSGSLAAAKLSRISHRRGRAASLLLTVGVCAAAVLVVTLRYRSYLAAAGSVAHKKDLTYRIRRVVLDPRTDACRWEPPSDTQSATWSEYAESMRRPFSMRAAVVALWHCSKLARVVEGNLNLRRASLWPFTLGVQQVIGITLAFLTPLFVLMSARLRRYELYLVLVGGYLFAMESMSVIETRRLYDVLFVALPVMGAGVAGVFDGVRRLRSARQWVIIAGGAALCLLAFTSLGGSLAAFHLGVRDAAVLLAFGLVLAACRVLFPRGLAAAETRTESGQSGPDTCFPTQPGRGPERAGRRPLPAWRWALVGMYLGALYLGLHTSRVRTMDWRPLRPGEEVSLEIQPFPEAETLLRPAEVTDISLLADVFAPGHRSGAPENDYELELCVNGHPVKGQTPGLNPLFDPAHDGRRECDEAGMLPVLARHNTWHGVSWAGHRHWQRYSHLPLAWITGTGRDGRPGALLRPVTVTLRNSGRRPLQILRCLGDFTQPRLAYLPALVAADGSQFRRGSAYAGSRLDDWRIPYKYKVSSALRVQTRRRGAEPADCAPCRFRYGVFLVVRTADGRRFVL